METKHDRFVRLAEKRTQNALNDIRLLANLANPRNYEYSSSEVDKIIKALKGAVSSLEHSFENSNKDISFKL